jgi:alpha-galactosidase
LVSAISGLGERIRLERSGKEFGGRGVLVETQKSESELQITLGSPRVSLTHLHLRWRASVDTRLDCFGDAWERSYGDLAWRGMVPERVMPWYFATSDGERVHAYGVKTATAALCFWQVDPEGVSLWMDVRNGGDGVVLGDRKVGLATLVTRRGEAGEHPVGALRRFCKQMAPKPRRTEIATYGVNDWYYAYGKNSQDLLLQMTDLVVGAAPASGPRPYTVVDDGWKEGSEAFPSMAGFAAAVRARNARPGIWIRPLKPPAGTGAKLMLPDQRFGERKERTREAALDPTIPEALEIVLGTLKQVVNWGFELIKHDYSTYDLVGQWGFEMGAMPSLTGWHFNDRSRTNAEIVRDMYSRMRESVGENTALLGCNTIGHLGAGIFDLQRTGDDVSGKLWERTRRMGVNTLAHRLAQHDTFFQLDADCVPITKDVPWEFTRQWLDVIARSKTALFVSPDNAAIGPEERAALRDAIALLVSGSTGAEPEDPVHETTPEKWTTTAGQKQYSWCGEEGASPFGL